MVFILTPQKSCLLKTVVIALIKKFLFLNITTIKIIQDWIYYGLIIVIDFSIKRNYTKSHYNITSLIAF